MRNPGAGIATTRGKIPVSIYLRRMRTLALAALLAPALMAAGIQTVEFSRPNGVPLTLDASVPDGAGPFAAVIVVHGGGFVNGDKQTYVKPLFDPLSKAGYAWFSINYRLAPEGRFPLAVDDVDAAVRWVKAHAREYRVDPGRLALCGESAGAHLVSFSAVRREKGAAVKAVVAFYGPHDLEKRVRDTPVISDGLKKFLGVSEINDEAFRKLHEASPYYFVRPGLPPFLLLHGTSDAQVPYEQSVRMCEKLKESGGQCELYTVPGGAHGMGAWERIPEQQGYKLKLVEWLKTNL